MNIEPLNENYLIEVEKSDTLKSLEKHGIRINPDAVKNTNIGKVIQVHARHGTSQLSPGDTVVFKPYGNEEVKLDDKEYLFVPEANIVGRIVMKEIKE